MNTKTVSLADIYADLTQLVRGLFKLVYHLGMLTYRAGRGTRSLISGSAIAGSTVTVLAETIDLVAENGEVAIAATPETLAKSVGDEPTADEMAVDELPAIAQEPEFEIPHESDGEVNADLPAIDHSVMTIKELQALAQEREIPDWFDCTKAQLIERLRV